MKTLNNLAIITAKKSWFVPYAQELNDMFRRLGYSADMYTDHRDLAMGYDVVFFLSYFSIVERSFLNKNKYNLVVHESDLPKGKGWAPLFWQVVEGRNEIPILLIEAEESVDGGKIYLRDTIKLEGHELHDEIRSIQAAATMNLCSRFLSEYENITGTEQTGQESFYRKRTPADSELDINRSLSEQFNLLRTVSNADFPAFFRIKGHTYILKIEKKDGTVSR